MSLLFRAILFIAVEILLMAGPQAWGWSQNDAQVAVNLAICLLVAWVIGEVGVRLWRRRDNISRSISAARSAWSNASAPPTKQADADVKPARGAHYDAADRQLVRNGLREFNSILWDKISPVQLDLHNQAIDAALLAIGRGELPAAFNRLGEHVIALQAARQELRERFVSGRDDGDEVWAIYGARDPLSGVINAIGAYRLALEDMPEWPSDALRDFANLRARELRDENGHLGNWVGRCIEEIRARRKELGGN